MSIITKVRRIVRQMTNSEGLDTLNNLVAQSLGYKLEYKFGGYFICGPGNTRATDVYCKAADAWGALRHVNNWSRDAEQASQLLDRIPDTVGITIMRVNANRPYRAFLKKECVALADTLAEAVCLLWLQYYENSGQ